MKELDDMFIDKLADRLHTSYERKLAEHRPK